MLMVAISQVVNYGNGNRNSTATTTVSAAAATTETATLAMLSKPTCRPGPRRQAKMRPEGSKVGVYAGRDGGHLKTHLV